ncbi:MAG: glycoside hydrolase family 15 protein [Solirubrobacterales bacterium]|nr:glycoside hydrolase family 15 protein [Solirubrobacterales bacterium]
MSDRSSLDIAAPHALREYAFVADGERGALVGPRGDLCWLCFPGWDGDALFASLLGGGGLYAVMPTKRFVWGGYYEHPGLIWRSRWVSDDGTIAESREALALPSTPDRAVLLRRIVSTKGPARMRAVLDLRFDFGRQGARRVRRGDDGVWRARAGGAYARWLGAERAKARRYRGGTVLELELELDAGRHHDLVLVLDADGKSPLPEPEHAWEGTESAWRERVPELEQTMAPRDARHAYAILSGLTSAAGGMVAAATTSLPERAEEGRSFDYRFAWIRDQCYAGQAVARAGGHPLLDDAVRFVSTQLLAHGPDLRPAYTTAGDRIPDEVKIDLPGYPGGRDTIGNWVNKQFQLDAFGEALLLLAAAADHDRLDADGWRAAEVAAEAIAARWQEPDAGIWELDPDHFTHSRLTCAAGLRQAARRQPVGAKAREWLVLADRITAKASAEAVHPSGRWQRSPSDERIDAALLLPAIRGAVAPEDPRTIATLKAVEGELTEDGYCYRYRPDERPLGRAEGAFLLCGFFLSLAYQQQGDAVAAARWFERNRAACGTAGLLAEEFDVIQRQLRGNIPQAFVHALLLECAAAQHGDVRERDGDSVTNSEFRGTPTREVT